MTTGAGTPGQPPPPTPNSKRNLQTFGPSPNGWLRQNLWQSLLLVWAFLASFLIVLLLLYALTRWFSNDDQNVGGGIDSAGQLDAALPSDDQAPAGPVAGTDGAAISSQGGPAPGSPSANPLRCPVMTDSIDRLYLAFFERPPNEAEFSRAVNRYRSGEASVEILAQELAQSDLFRQRYGPLDNVSFVEQIYFNSHGTRPSDEDLNTWVRALEGGRPRGAFVAAITETSRAVSISRTTAPLSGFLRQYPQGSHWYCGVGPANDLPITPLVESTVFADYLFHNGGETDSVTGIKTIVGNQTHLDLTSGRLPPGVTSYRWNGMFTGDGNYGTALDVEAGPNTWWVVVFYPSSIGEGRLGWEIDS